MRWIIRNAKVLAASIGLLLMIAVLLFHFVIIPGHTTRMLLLEGHNVFGTRWGPKWLTERDWDLMILSPRPVRVTIKGPLSRYCASLVANESSITTLNFLGSGVTHCDIEIMSDEFAKAGTGRCAQISSIYIEAINAPLDLLSTLRVFHSVSTVHLYGMTLRSSNLEWIGGLSQLSRLAICNTPINDDSLRSIVSSELQSSLRALEVCQTDITDAAGEHLAKLTGLKGLIVSSCRFGDEGVHMLGGVLPVKVLCVSDTDITAFGLRELARSPNLEIIEALHLDLTDDETNHLIADFPKVHFEFASHCDCLW